MPKKKETKEKKEKTQKKKTLMKQKQKVTNTQRVTVNVNTPLKKRPQKRQQQQKQPADIAALLSPIQLAVQSQINHLQRERNQISQTPVPEEYRSMVQNHLVNLTRRELGARARLNETSFNPVDTRVIGETETSKKATIVTPVQSTVSQAAQRSGQDPFSDANAFADQRMKLKPVQAKPKKSSTVNNNEFGAALQEKKKQITHPETAAALLKQLGAENREPIDRQITPPPPPPDRTLPPLAARPRQNAEVGSARPKRASKQTEFFKP